MQDDGKQARNWAQVRDRIDRGETGDKIAVEDPAAAPLGTDAEAGGSATAAEHIERSARLEQAGAHDAAKRDQVERRSRRRLALIALMAAFAASAAVVAVVWIGRP